MRLTAVIAMLAIGLWRLPAQTTTSFVALHTFTATSGEPATNYDGAEPAAGLVLSSNTLFGTTTEGGAAGYGTVFRVNTDGSGFNTLYNFTNGSDGAAPKAPLLWTNGMLYGTASTGGAFNDGTIFALGAGESNFSVLYTFSNGIDGARPEAGLLLAGGTLYGTTIGTSFGSSYGSVFMIHTNGSNFSVLHDFTTPVSYKNSDGFTPSGPLILQGSQVYGTCSDGGAHGTGTLFESPTNATSFDAFYDFAATSGFLENEGGANPQGGLVLSGGTLYGAAYFGGSNGFGTVFAYKTQGPGFEPLYTFTGGQDYIYPGGPLISSSNLLYGATAATIFSLTTNGTEFTDLFSTNADDFGPNGGLVFTGQSFYGTTQFSGTNETGMVFAFNLFSAPIPLTIQSAPDAVILTWPNSVFALQCAPSLTGNFTNVPGATSPYTNALTGSQAFFRLLAN